MRWGFPENSAIEINIWRKTSAAMILHLWNRENVGEAVLDIGISI